MIAISYRREDSLPIAGRLYDRLQAEFGRENVFMDFDSIPPGVDFRKQIKQTIERSNLVIAMIGPRWLGEHSDGSRRIDDPTDFVRLEIEYALKRGIPVIPLLINNTPMPKPEKLPPQIESLAFRNALPLDSGLDFHSHTDRLINGIGNVVDRLPRARTTPIQDQKPQQGRHFIRRAVTVLLSTAVIAFLAWFAVRGWQAEKSTEVASTEENGLDRNRPVESPQITVTPISPAPSSEPIAVMTASPSVEKAIASPTPALPEKNEDLASAAKIAPTVKPRPAETPVPPKAKKLFAGTWVGMQHSFDGRTGKPLPGFKSKITVNEAETEVDMGGGGGSLKGWHKTNAHTLSLTMGSVGGKAARRDLIVVSADGKTVTYTMELMGTLMYRGTFHRSN